ncbi:MAG: hypothetical protein V3V42_00455 [Candidatus Omnitrophota bacterium]
MHIPIIENYKSVFHIAMFFIAMFKINAIGRELNLLEKKFVNK